MPAKTRWRTDRPRRQPRRLGRASAADRPNPPAARAHGGDRPSDRRRREIWRARSVPDRRDQPQAAPPRAAASGSTRRTAARSTSDRRAAAAFRRKPRDAGVQPLAGTSLPLEQPKASPSREAAQGRGRSQGAAARAARRTARRAARQTEGEAAVNRLAIFDCDGTLVDSGATIFARACGRVRAARAGASAAGSRRAR